MKEVTTEQYNRAVEVIKTYNRQAKERFEASRRMARIFPIERVSKDDLVASLPINIRLRNAIFSMSEGSESFKKMTVRDLYDIDQNKLRRRNNFGEKSLIELNELLLRAE